MTLYSTREPPGPRSSASALAKEKPPEAASQFLGTSLSGDVERHLILASIPHEAQAGEAEDYHGPGGGLWNGARNGTGDGLISRKENRACTAQGVATGVNRLVAREVTAREPRLRANHQRCVGRPKRPGYQRTRSDRWYCQKLHWRRRPFRQRRLSRRLWEMKRQKP